MTLAIQDITDALASHALTLGYFERVNSYEPKSSPGSGLSGAVWVQRIGPAAGASGLAATSLRLQFTFRIYQNMLSEPQDAIDPLVISAASDLMDAYSGDFTLDGLVREVDLLGQFGNPLGGEAGYLNMDNKMYRIMDITIPLIIDDVYEQGA